MKPRPARAPQRRRKRWIAAALVLVAALVALVAGCSMLAPFEPAVPSEPMVASGITGHTLPTPEGPLYLVASAPKAGTAVVFIHGSPGTWEAFQPWLTDPELGAKARLVSVDRPGFGGSGRGGAVSSLAAQVRRIAAGVAAIGVDRAILVGHSLGGPVIARYAVDFPERVAGLLFIAPSIDPALEKHRWYNVAGSFAVIQWFLPVDWIVSNREIWPLRAELEALAPRLGGIRVPTIVLQGDQDDLVPPANSDYVVRAFTGTAVERRMIPGENHFVLWKQPALVREAVEELLEKDSTPSRRPAA